MTLKELTTQLHSLTKGHINGESFTVTELQAVIAKWLQTGNSYILEAKLPDGNWLCEISKNPAYGYGYFLPETRNQEKWLYEKLGIKL